MNTIRHYHRIGLLEEPARQRNGYKQYGVGHLVTLLRIRRLGDLGVPLSQIEHIGVGGHNTVQTLRELDDKLLESIDGLEKVRAEIAVIERDDISADVPAGFESVASRLSQTDQSMIHIYAQVYDEAALADIRKIAEADIDDFGGALDRLSPDADDDTRRQLVDRIAGRLAQNLIDHPWLEDPASRLSETPYISPENMADILRDLYNPAQLDVVARAHVIASERVRAHRETTGQRGRDATER